MATRIEKRFGATAELGTTYTSIGTVPGATTWNVQLNVTNRHATDTARLRAYVADTSWSSGEPTSGALIAAIAYDLPVTAGDVIQITGIVMNATEELVVYSDTASALDVIATGMEIS